jgi:hypothetical protein
MQPAIEVTREEWESRKLSKYGRFSSIIDTFSVALILGIMAEISLTMLPAATSGAAEQFWLAFDILLFITALKKLERIHNPLDFYQTIIIRG